MNLGNYKTSSQIYDELLTRKNRARPGLGDLSKFLIDHPPDSTITLTYVRGERETMIEITLGHRPDG